jgi:hypothetical protein
VVIFVSLWQIRHILMNPKTKPGERLVWMYGRIISNNALSPVTGLIFSGFKFITQQRLGHDLVITILFVLRIAGFQYSVSKYRQKVIGRVSESLAVSAGAVMQRRYRIALFAARWCGLVNLCAAVSCSFLLTNTGCASALSECRVSIRCL